MSGVGGAGVGELIGGSRRADGTVRKVRRVREGYTPPDEVDKYESAAQKFKSYAASGGVAGLSRPQGIFNEPAAPNSGKTKNQLKRERAKAAKERKAQEERAAKLAAIDNAPGGPDEKDSGNTSNVSAAPKPAADPGKRLKNLKKKLKAVEQLQAKLDSNELTMEKLEPEQAAKLKNRTTLEEEIADLEKSVGSMAV